MTQPLPDWISFQGDLMCVDASAAFAEMGLSNTPENQRRLVEEIKVWTKETSPGAMVMEEYDL